MNDTFPFTEEDLEEQQEMLAQRQAEEDAINAAALRFGNSPDGKLLLEYLRKITLERSTLAGGFGSGAISDPTVIQPYREGQNSIYRLLMSLINKGRTQHDRPKPDQSSSE